MKHNGSATCTKKREVNTLSMSHLYAAISHWDANRPPEELQSNEIWQKARDAVWYDDVPPSLRILAFYKV